MQARLGSQRCISAHRSIPSLLVVLVLSTAASAQTPATDAAANELTRLIDVAIADNPNLAAIRQRIAADEQVVLQAGALADPVFGLALSNMPVGGFAFSRSPMTGIQLMVRQQVPYPGKLRLRELAAQHGVQVTKAVYQEAEDELIRQVKQAYYQLYYINKAIELTQTNKRIAEAFAELAEVKYSVGTGAQADLANAQLEVSRYVDKLLALEEQLDRAEAGLNALLDRPPDAPTPIPTDLPLHELALSEQALRDVALSDRPLLQELVAQAARMETGVALARRDLKPDFNFGFDYRIRANSGMDGVAGSDFWGLSVGLNLPWFNKRPHQAKIAETDARLRQIEEQYRQARAHVFQAVNNALESMEKNRRQILLYSQGIVPQAELALSSAQSGYETGAVDFMTLLSAHQRLYQFQLDYYRAVADHERSVADVEFAIGSLLY